MIDVLNLFELEVILDPEGLLVGTSLLEGGHDNRPWLSCMGRLCCFGTRRDSDRRATSSGGNDNAIGMETLRK